MNDMLKNLIIWSIIVIILASIFSNFGPKREPTTQVSFSQFLDRADKNDISSVVFTEGQIMGVTKSNQQIYTIIPSGPQELVRDLLRKGIDVKGKLPESQPLLMRILINWFPLLLFIGIWLFFLRQMQGGGAGRGAMSFGRSRARLLSEDQVKITFADVAGADEAKEEVSELVDFLRDPGKFQRLGGRIPRGVLMVGPPGTGKTLLARAVAGEAKVPFFTISGSDFVEMFVGVGASRVRDMFEQAKKSAPCIIFIDEIDAVGRHRGAGLGGGHDEREQTLNQLLVEMDGFEGNEGVIVIAATNRPDVLDPALLRPGRFDRQVVVPLPDVRGREQILLVHLRKVPLAEDVKPGVIARGTPGFSGADLANLVNEAALFAAKANKRLVEMNELEYAKDKILMGAERHSMVMSAEEKKLTAYHESGHAIVGLSMPEHDPVYKVTIIPRGRALGVTMFLPEQDRYSHSKQRLLSQLCSLFGGRIAEELIFGEMGVTTGASNDMERATQIARSMVTKWGFSEKLGPIVFGEEQGEVFLGRSMTRNQEISEATATVIDAEVKAIIESSYQRAKAILLEKTPILHLMADALIKYETIDETQLKDLMAGIVPQPPKGWSESDLGGPTIGGDAVQAEDAAGKKDTSKPNYGTDPKEQDGLA